MRGLVERALSLLRRAGRGNAHTGTWSRGLEDEKAHWDRWFRTQGGEWAEDYRRRLDPELPLGDYHRRFVDDLPQDEIRILDVGAGPITLLGRTHPTKRIEIVATDALADEYDRIMQKYGVTPPVRTIYAQAERLGKVFPANSFDLVTAQNSIDHTFHPLRAIRQMLRVAKAGCYVLLNHTENEADKEHNIGLHQWNFTVCDGDFVIRGPSVTWNVSRLLAAQGEFECSCRDGWVQVHIKKRP